MLFPLFPIFRGPLFSKFERSSVKLAFFHTSRAFLSKTGYFMLFQWAKMLHQPPRQASKVGQSRAGKGRQAHEIGLSPPPGPSAMRFEPTEQIKSKQNLNSLVKIYKERTLLLVQGVHNPDY